MKGRQHWQIGLLMAAVILSLTGLVQMAWSIPQTADLAQVPDPALPNSADANRDDMNPDLLAAQQAFNFRLFNTLRQAAPDENLFISPTSVAIALSMLYTGAAGETQQAMAEALSLPEAEATDQATLNRFYRTLLADLAAADPNVALAIANSLWVDQAFPIRPTFQQTLQNVFAAEVHNADFGAADTLTRINQWVATATRDKIPQIIEQLSPDHVLVLLNAVYFKGEWTKQFDPDLTQEEPFFLAEGASIQHPLMRQRGEWRYAEIPEGQIISLPYGNERLSMEIVLPRAALDLETFQTRLTAENWQNWVAQLRPREGLIVLPRFTLESEYSLNRALQELGMANAFDRTANFAGISQEPTAIDQVLHKTYVEVNETGTEAAAVTAIMIRATSAGPIVTPFEMRVDRPFFCAIRDRQTGTLLFMGMILNPQP